MTSLRVACVIVVLAAGRVRAEGKEKPFPHEKSTILREEGVVYVVEGRITIPPRVEISCQKDVRIVGRGKDPTLVVEGDLAIHGVGAREVVLRGVAVELGETFDECRLDNAIFSEGSCLRTASGKPAKGKLHIELSQFVGAANVDVVLAHGSVELRSSTFDAPVRVRAENPDGADDNRVEVFVFGCNGGNDGLRGGLSVEGASECTVRLSRVGGAEASFVRCERLQLDGALIDAARLEIRQSVAGALRRTKVTKCDIASSKVVLFAPNGEDTKVDRVKFERCWFGGRRDPRVVHAEVIEDASDDPKKNVAEAILVKVGKRPLELAGTIPRR